MNIRTSTVALLLINAALFTGLAQVISAPVEPHWLPPEKADRTPVVMTTGSLPDLPHAQRAMTWTHPIFSRDRQPDSAEPIAEAKPLTGLTLTGVAQDGTSQWAYLREPGKPATKVAVGTTLDNGWTLSQLTPDTATFTRHGQTQTLSLPKVRLPSPSKGSAITLPRIQTP